jgi:hypothetical protein
MTKTLLIVSLVTLALGLALNVGLFGTVQQDAWFTILPLGPVFFGLYLIVKVLEKEPHDESSHHPVGSGASDPAVRH